MAIEVATLMQRATGGRPLEPERLFHPSWFRHIDEDPFWLWCHYHGPAEEQCDETTRFHKYQWEQGNEWEQRYVARTFPDAYRVRATWGIDALRETCEAMLRGETAICGAAMWLLGEEAYGKADLLVRCDAATSDLGDYHYRVKEIKHSATLKEYHQLQAAMYVWILGELQGFWAESFDVVLRDGAGECRVTYADVAPRMRRWLSEWQAIRDGHRSLQPLAYDSTTSPWRRYANHLLKQRGDVSLLFGIGPKTAVELRLNGYGCMTHVLSLGAAGCVQEFGSDAHYYHALAYQQDRPVFRPGERASITRRARIVHFDVEDTSVLDGQFVCRPHTYMVSVATSDGCTQTWTARGEDDEGRMWADFLDWLGDPSDVALYCWANYEFGKLDQASQNHPQLATRLLAAKAALIDLKEEIKGRPFFPVATYSIKSVAPQCGFRWSQDDVDGQSAQLMYLEWLRTGDCTIIERVEQYNREDVLAMVAVDNYVNHLPPGAPEIVISASSAPTCRRTRDT